MIKENIEIMGQELLNDVIFSNEHDWIDFEQTSRIPVVVCYVLP